MCYGVRIPRTRLSFLGTCYFLIYFMMNAWAALRDQSSAVLRVRIPRTRLSFLGTCYLLIYFYDERVGSASRLIICGAAARWFSS